MKKSWSLTKKYHSQSWSVDQWIWKIGRLRALGNREDFIQGSLVKYGDLELEKLVQPWKIWKMNSCSPFHQRLRILRYLH